MTCLRVNTLWCELVQDVPRPTIKDMLNWVFEDLKNMTHDFEDNLQGIQYEPNGMYLKFSNNLICEDLINKTNGEGKIKKSDGNIATIRLTLSSVGTKRIRIFRLPFELENRDIAANLMKYGEVLSVQDEYWSENFAIQRLKYKNGNRVATVKLTTHVPSFVTINGFRALITYEGQPKTCSYCTSPEHMIAECPNKRQKYTPYRNAVLGETQESNVESAEMEATNIMEQIQEVNIFETTPTTQNVTESETMEGDDETNASNKRAHPATSSDNMEPTTSEEDIFKLPERPANKKTKVDEVDESPLEDSEDGEPNNAIADMKDSAGEEEEYSKRQLDTLNKVKKYIENPKNPFPLTVENLNELISNCQRAKRIMEPIIKFTPLIKPLAETFKNFRPYIKNDRRTKLWITKILTAITEHLESEALILNS